MGIGGAGVTLLSVALNIVTSLTSIITTGGAGASVASQLLAVLASILNIPSDVIMACMTAGSIATLAGMISLAIHARYGIGPDQTVEEKQAK